jgi:CheY-like chemotaxis protein
LTINSLGGLVVTKDGPNGRALRVLVVDDSADMADTMTMLLGLWGHEARAAYTGGDALAVAATFLPAVALVDLAMPGMDGYCFAEALRSLPAGREAVLIAVTGIGGEEYRRRCAETGFAYYLLKPVALEELQSILCELAAPNAREMPSATHALCGRAAECVSTAQALAVESRNLRSVAWRAAKPRPLRQWASVCPWDLLPGARASSFQLRQPACR